MHLGAVVLYHRDGHRSHAVDFWTGRLNVITGASETGKSALIEIVDYCLGSDRHGVFRSPELDTIGWYGLLLRIGGQPVFAARRAPGPGQKSSTDSLLVEGRDDAPAAAEIDAAITNTASVTARLGELIGIEAAETEVPEGSTREPIRATLRHALAYVFQRQRLIADPEYLFSGQDRPFAAIAIRDTLPYFLGSVDTDALQLRRELRTRRRELARAEERLRRLAAGSDELLRREHSLLGEAEDAGLAATAEAAADDVRAALAALLDLRAEDVGEPVGGEAAQIAELDDRRRDLVSHLNEARAGRRQLAERLRLATGFAREVNEHRARLLSLELYPSGSSADERVCPLCGAAGSDDDATVTDLRVELEQARAQADNTRTSEPLLDAAIERVDERIAALRGQLSAIEEQVRTLVERSDLARQARSRREVQAFVRGRIATFLEEHPVRDAVAVRQAEEDVETLRTRVKFLEQSLGPEATRRKTERTLDGVGADMTNMARRLELGYTEHGVRLDPIGLTVVAGDAADPVWLNEDIGSGKNWVGFHLVTLLALHKHFVTGHRPVPRLLMLDQPTQAFYPSDRRRAPDRSSSELDDEDRRLVRRQFELMRDTVQELDGRLQIIVTDHANEPWFAGTVRHEWRDGHALVPRDWFE